MNCKLVTATLAAVIATAVSGSAFAQSCASPEAWQPVVGGDSRSGNTCLPAGGGTGDDSGSVLICGGLHDRKGPVYAFASTFSASRTFTTIALTGGAAGFDPVMFMTPLAGGCGANTESCIPSGDSGVPIAQADVPNGSWIIFVTAADIDAVGACGAFTLTSNGTFPVTLTNFTVS